MTWTTTKHMLKKAWSWIRNYWHIPALLAYTLVMVVVLRRDGSSAADVLRASKASYKEQVDVLNKTHAAEIQKREEIVKRYNKIMEEVETSHGNDMVRLNEDKKKRVKNLVIRHHDDPEQLTQLLKLTFGIHYEEG